MRASVSSNFGQSCSWLWYHELFVVAPNLPSLTKPYLTSFLPKPAGDFLKFTNTMAWSSSLLTWGLINYWDVYEVTGELNRMLDCIKWPLDYIIKAHVGHGEFVVQVKASS